MLPAACLCLLFDANSSSGRINAHDALVHDQDFLRPEAKSAHKKGPHCDPFLKQLAAN